MMLYGGFWWVVERENRLKWSVINGYLFGFVSCAAFNKLIKNSGL
jgi:hypothetical protein